MTLVERIAIEPGIMHGKPCVKGTRIPVYLILNLLAGGLSEAEVLADYPDLVEEDIRACMKYASILAEEEIGVLEAPGIL
jgi:uncharacterized protein (DUF433 family)